jgi:hypothetical protein
MPYLTLRRASSQPGGFLALAVLVVAGAIPGRAAAQRVTSTLDVQGTRLRYADTVDATATGITPSLRLDWKYALLSASGTYAQLSSAWSADGAVDGALFTPSRGPLSAELAGTVGGSTHQDGTRTGMAIGMGRLHLDGASAGVWIGAGGGATSDGFVWRGVRQGEAGAWLANGPASLTLTAEPTVVDDSIRYTDMTAEGGWSVGRLELGAVGGARAGAHLPSVASSATAWGSVRAVVWLASRVALLGSAGTYPVDYTQGFPGGRFASIGVRLSLTPRARAVPEVEVTAVAPVAGGVSRVELVPGGKGSMLRVLAPGARTVEVNGDFTAWAPRTLIPAGQGWFMLPAPIASGTYQMNVRVDGGSWIVPPSLTIVRDEFGGSSGVLVVP